MKVLIVDDSMIMRRILKNILKDRNLQDENLLDAPNGKVALSILEQNDIGLLLLDWNMPQLDGLELVKIIRSMDKYKDLPVIMVTSEAAKYNVLEAIKAGVTDYIVKPVSSVHLGEKIKRVLGQE
ncbi:MAG: response regulator [Candidatus Heimdallarchaeota archaeon]|nr:response regulator [Candidatus Heimdallarchaeota archaeon]